MTTSPPLRILLAATLPPELARDLDASPFGPFAALAWADSQPLATAAVDAVMLEIDAAAPSRLLNDALAAATVLVVSRDATPAATLAWLQAGVQDVLSFDELAGPAMPRRVRAAIERNRLARAARKAYATDLATGLPHQQQLIEHISQLLAIREREPAPMALLVLRVEGLATVAALHGAAAADVLRRKVAVRLRAGVRASDIVAALDGDAFAVLLASVLTPADAQRVGAKLVQALLAPFNIGGNDLALAVALGVGQYPPDGSQPDVLLRSALVAATAAPALGRVGMANFVEAGGSGAANDA